MSLNNTIRVLLVSLMLSVPLTSASADQKAPECAACRHELKAGTQQYPCDCANGHRFHSDCFVDWLYEQDETGSPTVFKKNVHCPICKKRSLLEAVFHAKPEDVTAVTELIGTGSDVNARSNDGATVLHWVCANQRLHDEHINTLVIAALVRGATTTMNATNLFESTPLHIAARACLPNTITTLLESKANPNTIDVFGKTPLQYARSRLPYRGQLAQEVINLLADTSQPD